MKSTSSPINTPDLKHFHWRAMENLQRDKEQSRLLHEPRFRIMTTDPISGHDIDDYRDHCSLLDGNLTIYFDTKENCEKFRAIPFDHPNPHLPFPASNEDDRGG